jgi:putative ABC transport system ATP-binding protein
MNILEEPKTASSFPLPGSGCFLELVNLSKDYIEGGQRRTVLHDTTLSICAAESVAILGKSGSGKTTLLNLVSGIDLPDRGDISVCGQLLTAMDDRQRTLFRRRNIGFVFQFFNLIPSLNVWENVILPLELNGLLNNEGRRTAQELLDEVGLGSRLHAFPDRLSGGEQQRVAIARALVHHPLLVLADEPTGNLDEETGRAVLSMLDRLTRRLGHNLVMVTHSSDAAACADRVFLLREGQLHPHIL